MTRENRQKAVAGSTDEALARERESRLVPAAGRPNDEERGEFGLQRLELARLARELGKFAVSTGSLRDRASLRAARDFLSLVSRDVVEERRARHAELIALYFSERARLEPLFPEAERDTDPAAAAPTESMCADVPALRR